MILGIDVSRYGHPRATGVEWYSYHLLNELVPLLGREHNTEVRLYSPHDFKPQTELPFNVHKRIMPMPRLWTTLRLSLEMLIHPVDILFVPSHTLPLFSAKKTVITIHDVAFLKLRKVYGFFANWQLSYTTKKAVKKAWRLITPSESTKNDLIKFYKCAAEKIIVIPHGAVQISLLPKHNGNETVKLRRKFFLENNELFILYIGRLETKKNLIRLIKAFERFLKDFPGWKLILAGKRGIGFEKIWKTVLNLKMEQRVICPGYITEKEKAFLLENCRIFAFPSLYEGFGLPVLEAFSYGKPVLTSNTTSLPEVAGKAAFLVNPEKVEEISVGLKKLAHNGVLVSELVQRSRQQLLKFSWEKAAQATFEELFGK